MFFVFYCEWTQSIYYQYVLSYSLLVRYNSWHMKLMTKQNVRGTVILHNDLFTTKLYWEITYWRSCILYLVFLKTFSGPFIQHAISILLLIPVQFLIAIVIVVMNYVYLCYAPVNVDGWDSSRIFTWWRHQTETFSVLLALCVGNSPVTGEFPLQRPMTLWCFLWSAPEQTVE